MSLKDLLYPMCARCNKPLVNKPSDYFCSEFCQAMWYRESNFVANFAQVTEELHEACYSAAKSLKALK